MSKHNGHVNGHTNGYTAILYRTRKTVEVELVHGDKMYAVTFRAADITKDGEEIFSVCPSAKPVHVERQWGRPVQIPQAAMSKVLKALPK